MKNEMCIVDLKSIFWDLWHELSPSSQEMGTPAPSVIQDLVNIDISSEIVYHLPWKILTFPNNNSTHQLKRLIK